MKTSHILNFLLLLVISVSTGNTVAYADGPDVGVVVPLTGPLAQLGQAVRNGLTLAALDQQEDRRIRFRFEDDQYDPVRTVSAVQKLLATHNIQGLIVVGAGPSLAIAPIVERAKIPTIAMTVAKDTTKSRAFVFRHWLDTETEGAAIAAEAKRQQYASIALVTTQNEAMIALRDAWTIHSSITPVLAQEVLPGERDFQGLAARIRALNPAAVFLCMMTPQAGILAKQLRALGYEGSFFSGHPLEIDPEALTGGALLHAWFVGNDERQASDLHQRYQKQFSIPASVGAANGYDVGRIMIEALADKDPANHIRTMKHFHGALGVYDATTDGGFTLEAAVRLVTAHGIVYAPAN